METTKQALFRALVHHDGGMVAAIVAIPDGPARFFILQRREGNDAFIGRISAWVKEQGGARLAMQSPDVLPQGVEVGEVLMRLRKQLGAGRDVGDAAEFDVANPEAVLDSGSGSRPSG
jgi:hypothetical protein